MMNFLYRIWGLIFVSFLVTLFFKLLFSGALITRPFFGFGLGTVLIVVTGIGFYLLKPDVAKTWTDGLLNLYSSRELILSAAIGLGSGLYFYAYIQPSDWHNLLLLFLVTVFSFLMSLFLFEF